MTAQILQLGGSLVAIALIVLLVRWLGLGRDPLFDSDDAVREAADEAMSGFRPVAVIRDAKGRAALARDAHGRVMVLRPHGAHVAARLLGRGTRAAYADCVLIVDPRERRFGPVSLRVEELEASAWMQAIEGIE